MMRPAAAALATLAVILLVTLPIRWHHRHEAATSQQENPTIGSDDGRTTHPRADRTLWRPPLTPAQATTDPPLVPRQIMTATPSPVRATPSARPTPVGKQVEGGRELPPLPTTRPKPTAEQWAALRACESGGRYDATNPSGKYRGAYQWDQPTWDSNATGTRWVGHDPATVPADVQDYFAALLYQRRGWAPWPQCGKGLA